MKTQHIRTVITNKLMSINNCQERSRGIGQIYQLPGWKANLLSVITAFSFSLSPGTAKTSLLLKRFNLLSPTGRKLPADLQGCSFCESCCKELAGDGRKRFFDRSWVWGWGFFLCIPIDVALIVSTIWIFVSTYWVFSTNPIQMVQMGV